MIDRDIVVKDGEQMAVLRPTDPEVAKAAIAEARRIAEARKAGTMTADEADAAFQAIVGNGERVFEGLLTKTARIVDPLSFVVRGDVQPGDSFVGYETLCKAQSATASARSEP